MEAQRPLEEIVANRRWLRRSVPFPHVLVPDLFIPRVAEEIDVAVRKRLETQKFGKISGYDAGGWGFPQKVPWPLRLFVTPAWGELVSRTLGVTTVPYVSAVIHHHAIGGQSGRPHNDLNPEYFPDLKRGSTLILQDGTIHHKNGEPLDPSMPPPKRIVRRVRGISLLYYTANPPWQPGEGGETGLYSLRSDPVNRPVAAVAPRNNTLLAFETTPHSFHSFISNTVTERNSITMWLYISDDAAVARWGERNLERWAESPPAPPEDPLA